MTSKKQFQPSAWSPRGTEVDEASSHVPKCKHKVRAEFNELVCTYCGTRWYPNMYAKHPKWITATTDNRYIPENQKIVEKRGRPADANPNKER